ncbi:MAG: hypothetical protein AB7T07_11025 [Steroidobacteraceae bacterium]
MWQLLDVLLIAVVVLLSGVYAIYALSSVRMKRILLSLLVRCFGVRVFAVFSPRISGCSNCDSAVARHAEFLRKLKRIK